MVQMRKCRPCVRSTLAMRSTERSFAAFAFDQQAQILSRDLNRLLRGSRVFVTK